MQRVNIFSQSFSIFTLKVSRVHINQYNKALRLYWTMSCLLSNSSDLYLLKIRPETGYLKLRKQWKSSTTFSTILSVSYLRSSNQPDEHTLPIKTTRPAYYQVSILQKAELNKITQQKNTTKLACMGKTI